MFGKKKRANEITVCNGKYTVKRLSADAFLRRVETMQALASHLIMLQGEGLIHQLDHITKKDTSKDIAGAMLSLGAGATRAIMDVLCEFTDITPERMYNDPDIGFGGVGEILAAVIEINGIDLFFTTAFPALKSVWKGIVQDPATEMEKGATNP